MYHFNLRNPTETGLLRVLSYGEGIITRDQFLETANRTLLSKYRTNGLIKQKPDAPKGVFQTTDKFQRLYLQQVNPEHHFSGSGSMNHSSVLYETLKLLPQDAPLISGQTLKAELEQAQKSMEYQRKEIELRERYKDERDAASVQLRHAQNLMQRYEALNRYNEANKLYSRENLCSAADLKVTLNRDQLDELLTRFHDRYRNDELTQRQERFTYHAIQQLQQLQASGTETVEIFVECVTDSYNNIQIQEKLATSFVLDTPIIFVS